MDQQPDSYYYQQSNPYYHQQSYPQSNTYAENAVSHVNHPQHQGQIHAQRFESQGDGSTRTQQYSNLQPHLQARQPYFSEPHSQLPSTSQQSQMEVFLHNSMQRTSPFAPSMGTQQYPYPAHLSQEQNVLRHVHSQPVSQRNPATGYSAYEFNLPSRISQTSSRPSAPYSGDPISQASYRDEQHGMQVTDPSASSSNAGSVADAYGSTTVPRLPPILEVERQQVTTTATQNASANRRRNEANFHCPVPGCGSTFTRRFNLKGHLRSHTSERPFACEWPGCDKAFARQHDCKRHYQLHSTKAGTYLCQGCGKSFSRTDALNRHLRSEGGSECRSAHYNASGSQDSMRASPSQGDSPSPGEMTDGGEISESYFN